MKTVAINAKNVEYFFLYLSNQDLREAQPNINTTTFNRISGEPFHVQYGGIPPHRNEISLDVLKRRKRKGQRQDDEQWTELRSVDCQLTVSRGTINLSSPIRAPVRHVIIQGESRFTR